jgi:multicomponent K+:H+ antiporter subunit D
MFGEGWLLAGGVATVAFAALGMLASQDLHRLAGYGVLLSSGTLLAAIGMNDPDIVGPALFYLVSSTLALGAFFLLIELIERGRAPADDILAVTLEAYGLEDEEEPGEESASGVAVPAVLAVLGIAFIACGLLLAGLPPLSGFIAKFAILSVAFGAGGMSDGIAPPAESWLLAATLLVSGFVTVVTVIRAGIRSFWASIDRQVPHVRLIEVAPVLALLGLCIAMTIQAGSTMTFLEATADSLHYQAVRAQLPTPQPAGGGAE